MTLALPALPRRRLVKLGIASAAVFALAGGAALLWRPGLRQGRLTASGRAVFGAVAAAVLEGSLGSGPTALEQHLSRLDETIAGLPTITQDELAQLLGLLSLPSGRQWLTGLTADWPEATVLEVGAALHRMLASGNELRQQAYHALRDLTNAAFYAQPEHWPLMGYPGPASLS